MPWVKVPPENHPLFYAALPNDLRVETLKMFGGVAAKVNGHIFAGLFGRSTMLFLSEPDRGEALALEGAELFDPMGNGRVKSDKVMLPESLMEDAAALRAWIARAFESTAALPPKARRVSTGRSPAGPIKTSKSAPGSRAKRPGSTRPTAKSRRR